MKKLFLCTMMVLLMMTGIAQATLITIGTATYKGADYKLIWQDNNNGKSLVWLDYMNALNNYDNQVSWASGLDTVLAVNLYDGYVVDWGGSSWRLPATVEYGDNGTISEYNITSSEMGHLFYVELSNLGYYDTSGNYQPEYGLIKKGEFENLKRLWYWSNTEYAKNPSNAWRFDMNDGGQGNYNKMDNLAGLAVRSGQVTVSSVPLPGAILLLGAGLLWVAGLARKSRRDV